LIFTLLNNCLISRGIDAEKFTFPVEPCSSAVVDLTIFYMSTSLLVVMRLLKIIVGELAVLIASVLIFRSLWTLMDQYLGYTNLELFLVLGIIVTIIGFILLNDGVKSKIEENNKTIKS
jgi:hypothetical protein